MSIDTTIPPTPYQSPVVGQNGLLTIPWANWFKQLYLRSGGSTAPSITAIQSSIVTLQSNIATLQTSLATLNTTVTNLQNIVNGLSVGRQL